MCRGRKGGVERQGGGKGGVVGGSRGSGVVVGGGRGSGVVVVEEWSGSGRVEWWSGEKWSGKVEW